MTGNSCTTILLSRLTGVLFMGFLTLLPHFSVQAVYAETGPSSRPVPDFSSPTNLLKTAPPSSCAACLQEVEPGTCPAAPATHCQCLPPTLYQTSSEETSRDSRTAAFAARFLSKTDTKEVRRWWPYTLTPPGTSSSTGQGLIIGSPLGLQSPELLKRL